MYQITGHVLFHLDAEDLKNECQIESGIERKKILATIDQLDGNAPLPALDFWEFRQMDRRESDSRIGLLINGPRFGMLTRIIHAHSIIACAETRVIVICLYFFTIIIVIAC